MKILNNSNKTWFLPIDEIDRYDRGYILQYKS